MKQDSVSEQLVRLAYAEIILHHAEVDSVAKFADNLQKDLSPEESSEVESEEEVPVSEDSPETVDDEDGQSEKEVATSRWRRIVAKFKSDRRLVFGVGIAALLIFPLLFLLFWSNFKYQDKILPGTTYASTELSSDPQEALEQIKQATADYGFKLKFGDSEKIYSAAEVGVQLSPEQTLDAAKVQSNQTRFFLRPLAMFGSREVETAVNIDQDKLKSFLEAQNYSDKLPEDAKIEFNSEQGKFTIIPEVAGRGIDSKSFSKKLEDSAKKLSKSTIDLEIEDVTPSVTTSNLGDPLLEANSFISQKITLSSPNKNYTPGPEVMKDWVILTADPGNSTYQVAVNTDSIKGYVDSVVKKVNRKMEKRLYASIDGSDMLLQEGQSGLQVSNIDTAKSELAALFKAKKSGSVAFETKEEQPTTENIAATGGRWIFADLSQFKIYAYEGSHLVNSFSMSSGKASTPTPTGRYSVMSKVRVKTMTSGGNKNSKDYYSVPNIEWVAYFKSGGYAMHGVYWHNKFGIENTSHGCMGMSNTNAKWVYDFVDIGTPVIIVP